MPHYLCGYTSYNILINKMWVRDIVQDTMSSCQPYSLQSNNECKKKIGVVVSEYVNAVMNR